MFLGNLLGVRSLRQGAAARVVGAVEREPIWQQRAHYRGFCDSETVAVRVIQVMRERADKWSERGMTRLCGR